MIEQSDSDSETSDRPPPVFVPEGGNATAQQDKDDESIVPLNAPARVKGAPPNIPFVELDDMPAATHSTSVADSHNPYKPDSEHLHQRQMNLEMSYQLST